ncbi:MAG: LON peptidase substrate-binding domain-containing protein [Bacteroidia bacterium]|nr:LON peptidase substrate-binding domain-containing protein [Bacteroidia bacterium]
MPVLLPLFPLSLVVYPGETIRLHIFEPRYKQLVREALEQGTTFGIPAVLDQKPAGIATEMQVVRLDREYGGGELDITCQGSRKAAVREFYRAVRGKLYPGGAVEWIADERSEAGADLQYQLVQLYESFQDALGIRRPLPETGQPLSYRLAHLAGMTVHQEYEVLSLHSEAARIRYLIAHLEQALPIVRETERLKSRVKLNGHFKNLVPPDF